MRKTKKILAGILCMMMAVTGCQGTSSKKDTTKKNNTNSTNNTTEESQEGWMQCSHMLMEIYRGLH